MEVVRQHGLRGAGGKELLMISIAFLAAGLSWLGLLPRRYRSQKLLPRRYR